MIGVLIVPTGIGAEIGGHAGDANPVVKLISGCCDKLIVHPNVVNASDINEMTENTLYVEGSILDRFLEGSIRLKEVNQNKILVVVNKPVRNDTLNAISAARVTIGVNVEILELDYPFRMIAEMDQNGKAGGVVLGHVSLIEQISKYSFDVLAIHSLIEVDRNIALNYYKNGGVNPWGGVEAKASKLIASVINKPVAHAPLEASKPGDKDFTIHLDEVVDPRIAPEVISACYLHCVLKGLNKAPRISHKYTNNSLEVEDIDFLISPYGCWGRPHIACMNKDIPIIVVKENKTILDYQDNLCDILKNKNIIFVENYWEAVGFIMSMKAGIFPHSVRRPIRCKNCIDS